MQRFSLWVFVGIAVIAAGCAGGNSANLPTPPSLAAPPNQSVTSSGQLIYVPNSAFFGANSITVYPADANGNVAPVKTIHGAISMVNNPAAVAFDRSGKLFVSSDVTVGGPGCIQEFLPGASDDAAPVRTICGDATGLIAPSGMAFDRAENLFVANLRGGEDTQGTVTVYPPSANGNVRPSFTLVGPHTGLNLPIGLAFDSSGKLYVANFGGVGTNFRGSITVYAAGACSGDVAPIATIEGPNTTFIAPSAITLDPDGNIYVTDLGADAIDIFSAGATGDVAPVRRIAGPNTTLEVPEGVVLDASGEIYESGGESIAVFSHDADGDATPLRAISGNLTQLSAAGALALH